MSHFVECPLCFKNFSSDFIQVHAQKCKGELKRADSDLEMPASKKAKITPSKTHSFFSPKQSKGSSWNGASSKPKKDVKGNSELMNSRSKVTSSKNPFGKSQSSTSSFQPTPLAERSRPSSVEEYVGQRQIFGENSVLNDLLLNNVIPSMIFWGPPGCGKTSLANVIATRARSSIDSPLRFVKLSATSSGKADVQAVVETAKNDWKMFKRRTILFIDEIHRFNKLQQDTFLPHVEDGTIILIGATTENPSFSLNSALLSRCRVIVLEKLSAEEVKSILMRALKKYESDVTLVKSDMSKYNTVANGGGKTVESLSSPNVEEDISDTSERSRNESSSTSEEDNIDISPPDCEIVEDNETKTQRRISISEEAVFALANLCDGDARIALTGLQMSIQAARATLPNSPESSYHIDLNCIKKCFQRSHVLYDRKGDQHYDIISAFHKSIRGSDDNAALYWLTRMLEGGEDPRFVTRRMIRIASEDIGLADPNALNLAVSTQKACEFVGMPESDVILAQCAVYLARAPKSVEVYFAYLKAKECIKNHEGPLPGVPLHLRNAPTQLMKSLGYGKNYSYKPCEDQTYLPDNMLNCNFFDND